MRCILLACLVLVTGCSALFDVARLAAEVAGGVASNPALTGMIDAAAGDRIGAGDIALYGGGISALLRLITKPFEGMVAKGVKAS